MVRLVQLVSGRIWRTTGSCIGSPVIPHLHKRPIDTISSSINLFADDVVIYRKIETSDDHHTRQNDLQLVEALILSNKVPHVKYNFKKE